MKKTVCVDVDGCLAEYDGWKGVEHIGNPFPGAKEFMEKLKENYEVVIFTTRANEELNGKCCTNILVKWLQDNEIPYDRIESKPIFVAMFDDRAFCCSPGKDEEDAYHASLEFLNFIDPKATKQDSTY